MPPINPPLIAGFDANETNTQDIPASQKTDGYATNEIPLSEHHAFMFNQFYNWLNYLKSVGTSQWDVNVSYPQYARTMRNGIIFVSKADFNQGNDPLSVSASWRLDVDETDTLATMRAITYPINTIYATGHTTVNDGAFGSLSWRWNSTSTESDNNGTIVKLTSIATGRYKLQYDGDIQVEWFGAIGDDSNDDTLSIQAALNASKEIRFKDGKIYIVDPLAGGTGTGLYVQPGTTIYGYGATAKIKPNTYADHIRLFAIDTSIIFSDSVTRRDGYRIFGLAVDGNSVNVTMQIDKSSCAFYLYKHNKPILRDVKIKNMPIGNGGLPGIIFRFCDDFAVENINIFKDGAATYCTDRQGILALESDGYISGGSIGVSKIREPILVTSEDGLEYKQSNVHISNMNLDNTDTESGSRIIRFSGVAAGSVRGCTLNSSYVNTGTSALISAFYLGTVPTATFPVGLKNDVILSGNIIKKAGRGVEYGTYIPDVPPYILKVIDNSFEDLTRGCDFDKGNITEDIVFSANTFVVSEYSIKSTDAGSIKIIGDTFDGGTDYGDFIDHNHLEISNCTFKNNTNASQTVRIGAKALGGDDPIVTATTVTGSVKNEINAGAGAMIVASSNSFFTSGFWVKRRDGFWHDWISSGGVMYLKGGTPINDTDGTIVGTQT